MQKNALIIGGSSGIGLAAVKKLAANRFNIYVVHRDRKKDVLQLEETLAQLSSEHSIVTKSFNFDATNAIRSRFNKSINCYHHLWST